MKKIYFVTGTDTDVGKTVVTLAMMETLKRQQKTVLGIKPIASGHASSTTTNGDALSLQQASSSALPYADHNPFLFHEPIAPHIAAAHENRELTVEKILSKLKNALAADVDVILIEGVGGWMVPLNDRESVPDLVKALDIPVIMVVGLRLGCLNHAWLTYESILQKGQRVAGWIGNQIEPDMPACTENIVTLREKFHVPCLGIVPYFPEIDPTRISNYLDLRRLLNSQSRLTPLESV